MRVKQVLPDRRNGDGSYSPVTITKELHPKRRKIVINISQEVFDYIAKNSLPLVDSPDSTLRRLFGLPPKKSKDQT